MHYSYVEGKIACLNFARGLSDSKVPAGFKRVAFLLIANEAAASCCVARHSGIEGRTPRLDLARPSLQQGSRGDDDGRSLKLGRVEDVVSLSW
jgi:hypothetical protein